MTQEAVTPPSKSAGESFSEDALDEPAPQHGVFVNRTLNLRSVQVIGYDMDYTLIHYRVAEWEKMAFNHGRAVLASWGLPVEGLSFDPEAFTIGLVFDLQLGNLLKATRFGYVVRGCHGNEMLTFDEVRASYSDTVVELSEPRFVFMNTLFDLSLASLWTQLVDLHDKTPLPGVSGYGEIYTIVSDALAETHLTSSLKADILADPDRFVEPDPNLVATLLDQRSAGKRLLLITNSNWNYTQKMMAYTVNAYCDPGSTWRDLFDIVIVSADKPRFFSQTNQIYRVVDEERSLLAPHPNALEPGQVYFGGNAQLVEKSLRTDGQSPPLYVGDHLFGDVLVSKDLLRWRTALVARELEDEIIDMMAFKDDQAILQSLMADKVALDRKQARLYLENDKNSTAELGPRINRLSAQIESLDADIGPLAKRASEVGNQTWGPLMRAGNDKSLFARQVERYADVYTSRVSNLRHETPYGFLRAARGSLPHDKAASRVSIEQVDTL